MSHSTVMVALLAGEKLEALLEPYNENTQVERYQKRIDIDEDSGQNFYRRMAADQLKITDASMLTPQQVVEGYNAKYATDDDDEDTLFLDVEGHVYRWSTYNPNSKWDWWVIGGRWTGYFKPKKGASGERILGRVKGLDNKPDDGFVDVILKKDVDVEGMKEIARREAMERYDRFQTLVGDQKWEAWDVIRARWPDDIEKAREEYHAQFPIKASREKAFVEEFGFMMDIDQFLVSREAFIDRAAANALVPFAFLDSETGWHEKGDMGWWGIVRHEKQPEEWGAQFERWWNTLPDDAQLAIVDVHI